uniref:Uncharacterized protein n=1 Tax=uncultured Armatimonadetes bacterium TaxID=157466 RepID=A0A6J4J8M2_9BACT|nr:hypothetical protein AVDCRST_MAG63-2996 [uncultured Armatimonadetes bacterium]
MWRAPTLADTFSHLARALRTAALSLYPTSDRSAEGPVAPWQPAQYFLTSGATSRSNVTRAGAAFAGFFGRAGAEVAAVISSARGTADASTSSIGRTFLLRITIFLIGGPSEKQEAWVN